MIPQKNPLIASGESVHANMFFKLWENPDPSSTFASQPITLSSSDYDFVLLIGRLINGSARDISVIAPKGDSAYFVFSTYSSGAAHSATRLFTYTDDTHLAVSDASVDSSTNNAYLIPVAIYGFKKSIDITAIVSNVSTDARQCMLDDGVTTVQNMHDSTCIVTGTMANTVNTEVRVPFPDGFTADNCYVKGYLARASSNWYSNHHEMTVFTSTGDGIRVYTSNTGFLGNPFKILLEKVV